MIHKTGQIVIFAKNDINCLLEVSKAGFLYKVALSHYYGLEG